MPYGRAAEAAKNARQGAGITQLEMTFDEYFGSRESISHQENGRYQVQPELARYYVEKHNDPWVAFEAAAEYIGWGPVKLDGEAVDLHRTSAALKSEEELEEALQSIRKASRKLTINPKKIQSHDLDDIRESILEQIDVITALTNNVAIWCQVYEISWTDMWARHKSKLISRGYVRNDKEQKRAIKSSN